MGRKIAIKFPSDHRIELVSILTHSLSICFSVCRNMKTGNATVASAALHVEK